MIVLGATFTLMQMVFTANAGMGDMMATQQNVRVAVNTIARDITMAGTGLPSGTVASPNGLNSAPLIRPGMTTFSSAERTLKTTPTFAIPIISPGDNSGPTVSVDTDALTIFTINQDSPNWYVSTVTPFTDRYEITFTDDVTQGAKILYPGDLLLFNNANGSVLGCVSDVSSLTAQLAFFRSTDTMGMNQPTAAAGNIGSLANMNGTYPPTTATRVNIINYYIKNDMPGHPKLMRAVNAEPPQEIARDIENLQFSFDLYDFLTEVGNANQPDPPNPNQIRAVLVSITGRSPEPLARTSAFYRFSLVSKISVRNSTFRNRYSGV
jgi:hypothetical protein